MSVLIGHASIDEQGKASGGSAGDQSRLHTSLPVWSPALPPDALFKTFWRVYKYAKAYVFRGAIAINVISN